MTIPAAVSDSRAALRSRSDRDPRPGMAPQPGASVGPVVHWHLGDVRLGPDTGPVSDCGISVVAASAHSGPAAVLVRRLKYGRCSAAIGPLADAMAAVAPPADLVTWVPASRSRRRDRGYDQSELLARAVARRLRLPVRRLLRRIDDHPQTARSRQGRAQGPTLAATGQKVLGVRRILLVDDVVTTGATMQRASALLAGHGTASVVGLVATRAAG